MYASRSTSNSALTRRLLPITWALVVVVAVLLALTWIALRAQTSIAGFLNGQSIWASAQKQAVIELNSYAISGNAQDYTDFRHDYGLLINDSWARDAVLKPTYDREAISRAFDRGDVMPTAMSGMIFILRHLSWAPYVNSALSKWRASDPYVAELGQVGNELHALYTASAQPAPEAIAALRARISAINDAIAPLSNGFSRELALGTEWFGKILFLGVVVAACIACLLWLGLARRVFAGIRSTEQRYLQLFDSAADAIVMVDESSGRIVGANHAAGAWTGYKPEELNGVPYASLFEPHDGRGGALRRTDGTTRPVETQDSAAMWGSRVVRQSIIRDISERVERDRSQRIAAEALANIADGVIIADAERHILSLNAAASRLTGFAADELIGKELGALRTLHGDAPIGPAVWDAAATHGHWVGQVQSRRRDGSTYAEKLSISTIHDAARKLQYYVAVFSDISEATEHHNRLQHLASHDALTGLVNRPEFQHRCANAIEKAAQNQGAVAVLFIDLDTFKVVNDRYNHAVGDRLLKVVSQRIQHELRAGDVAGRIGGDEFTALLPGLGARDEAAVLAERLCNTLSQPFQIGDCELMISASIGIAAYPLDGDNPQTLIANADAAMYVAKSEERNAWRFYTPVMRADIDRRSVLATELRQALAAGDFQMVYQPVIEVRSSRIVGVEALLRWHRPGCSDVRPDEFIPVAESVGLIYDIDAWVMQSVCAQIRLWDHSRMPRIKVAINVSARWFDRRGLVECVKHALETNAVAPERIVLEITESAILRTGSQAEHTMRELADLGVGVAIDDFGTGYASMTYLKLPAITHLKIDRSFVAGLPGSTSDAAIVSGMIALARSLGVTTIAEGIETDAQDQFLRDAGCAEAQGYRYSYPLSPAELERLLLPKWQAPQAKLTLVSNHS